MVVLGIYFLLSGTARKKVFSFSGKTLLLLFTCYAAFIALVRDNFIGFACAIGFFFIFVISYYIRREITSDVFQRALDISCWMCWIVFLTVWAEKMMQSHQENYRCEGLFKWFFNSNYLGSLMAMMIVVCVYKLLISQKGKPFYIITALLCVMSIYLSGSILAFIEVIVGILALLILYKKHSLVIAFIAFATFVVLLLFIFPDIFPRILELESTTNNRIKVWDSSIEFIKISPLFGHGFLSYHHLHELYGSLWEKGHHTHNFILEPILSFGAIGTILFVMYLWSYYEKVSECKSLLRKTKVTNLILAISAATITHCAVDLTVQWIQTGLLFVLILGGIGVDEKALERRIKACLKKSEKQNKSSEEEINNE